MSLPESFHLCSLSYRTHDIVGRLREFDDSGNVCKEIDIHANKETTIGRDPKQCQCVLWDPTVSNKHVRIHATVSARHGDDDYEALIYAEDLSFNGTFLNEVLMGRGKGGFLLSDGDILRLSHRFKYQFVANKQHEKYTPLKEVQETEAKHFNDEFILTSRCLGSGTFESTHMAFDAAQSRHMQYACRVIDLRKFKKPRKTNFGRWERPAKATEVDDESQLRNIKELATDKISEERLRRVRRQSQLEAEILKDLNHPNIVGFEKLFVTNNTIYVFQELVSGGDLSSYLESRGGTLAEVDTTIIVHQILNGINYLHQHNIVHRDLNPENILLASRTVCGRIVLTGFGKARRFGFGKDLVSSARATGEYAAPELSLATLDPKKPTSYNTSVDLWSLGCIAATILIGTSPFHDPQTRHFDIPLAQTCDLTNLHGSVMWQGLSPRPKDFIDKLLQLESSARLTALQALRHEWFTAKIYTTELQEQYQRSIRDWRPRRPRFPLVETFAGGALLKPSPFVKSSLGKRRKHNSPVPVDPPYRPFARKMHRPLLPVRSNSSSMTPEVRAAIITNWSEEAMQAERAKRHCLSSNANEKFWKRRAYSPAAWDTRPLIVRDLPSSLDRQLPSPPISDDLGTGAACEAEQVESRVPFTKAVNSARQDDIVPLGQVDSKANTDPTVEVIQPSSTRLVPKNGWKTPLQERPIDNSSIRIRPASHVTKKGLSTLANTKSRRTASIFDLEQ